MQLKAGGIYANGIGEAITIETRETSLHTQYPWIDQHGRTYTDDGKYNLRTASFLDLQEVNNSTEPPPNPTVPLPLDGETITNEKGAKQSFVSAAFDCIPPVVLRLLAQCLGFGARKYGKENWRGIPIEDNLSHAMNHINEFRMGDRSEPHLVNAMARLTFALTQAVEAGDHENVYVHPDMLKG